MAGGSRRCHDCGKPTPDYRCRKCWARIRAAAACDPDARLGAVIEAYPIARPASGRQSQLLSACLQAQAL